MIIALLVLITAIATLYFMWWAPREALIRARLHAAKPIVYFTLGSYGGPDGNGIGLNLQNRGTNDAYKLSLYLHGSDGFVWKKTDLIDRLSAGATPYIPIPLAVNDPLRTRAIEGLSARLVYHDRFGRPFVASLHLVQRRRRDGFYNIPRTQQQPQITSPTTGFSDLWRLRKRV
jgi:hypothetical protein